MKLNLKENLYESKTKRSKALITNTNTVVISILCCMMITGSFGLVNFVNAQTNTQNNTLDNNNTTSQDMQMQNTTATVNNSTLQLQEQQQRQNNNITSPDMEIIVFADDLFEIRDNLAEARQALDAGNLFTLHQEIENIDRLITVLLNPLPANVTHIE